MRWTEAEKDLVQLLLQSKNSVWPPTMSTLLRNPMTQGTQFMNEKDDPERPKNESKVS